MWAERYVGLPWLRLGRDRRGLDCWGLSRLVLVEQRRIALPLYDTVDPAFGNQAATAIAEGKSGWLPVAPVDMREFDFVVMRTAFPSQGRMISKPVHIGVASSARAVLHIQEGGSAVIQTFDALRHRVAEILRHRDLV